MAAVVLLLVHLEICDQHVFVVTERVVECHRALIVCGARCLGGGILYGKRIQDYVKQDKVYIFICLNFVGQLKGSKILSEQRKYRAL